MAKTEIRVSRYGNLKSNQDIGGLLGWTVYDCIFENYLKNFTAVDVDDVITRRLQRLAEKPTPVIVDFLSSTTALRSLQRNFIGRPIKGLAVGFSDHRDDIRRKLDDDGGITQLTGDLARPETWQQIQTWLGNDHADLIVERGAGGLNCLPTKSPNFYRLALINIWDILSVGGLMLIQTHSYERLKEAGIPITDWLDQLEEQEIYTQFLPKYKFASEYYGSLLIAKHTDKPISLEIPSREATLAAG